MTQTRSIGEYRMNRRNMMNRRDVLAFGLGALAATTSGAPALAQTNYPDQPIRLIVPRSAGGVLDIIGRGWADRVTARLGAVAVENRGGGGGVTGTAAAAHAPADGYTLLLGSTSDLVLNPVIQPQVSYDPVKDFAPIGILAISVASIIVHPSVPARSLQELAAYAKQNPGKLSYGSAGVGTMANLCGELFKQMAGTPDIVHVPYKGAAAGYGDLVAGHIKMMASNVTGNMLEMHRSGQVRILAVATDHRVSAAPDIPTAAEAGFPGLVAQLFVGVFAPAATPKPIIARLVDVTREIAADKDFQRTLETSAFEPLTDFGPEKTARYLNEELARWTPVLKVSGLRQL
jgi:tripartite-type tricarboxylate transporter receptor subunit TctC